MSVSLHSQIRNYLDGNPRQGLPGVKALASTYSRGESSEVQSELNGYRKELLAKIRTTQIKIDGYQRSMKAVREKPTVSNLAVTRYSGALNEAYARGVSLERANDRTLLSMSHEEFTAAQAQLAKQKETLKEIDGVISQLPNTWCQLITKGLVGAASTIALIAATTFQQPAVLSNVFSFFTGNPNNGTST